ncbi:hypothetical protein BESB_036990 [Besnoitia besnoiti]|uniref:MI domain-containing protein n=1 Tax=Besnoitia besnoiti TaxID=94643 RepID=A0A2A9MLM6_BESBE|nr:hypothetical protein BESB_036990 [Besnoitia besnoiti]PFH37241.1 hypothetical protein BESB_036990 [Besnoitia besnoiti]
MHSAGSAMSSEAEDAAPFRRSASSRVRGGEKEEGCFGHEEALAEGLRQSKKAVLSRKRRRHEERKQRKQVHKEKQKLWKLERQKELLERQMNQQKAAISGLLHASGKGAGVRTPPHRADAQANDENSASTSEDDAAPRVAFGKKRKLATDASPSFSEAASSRSAVDVRGSVQAALLANAKVGAKTRAGGLPDETLPFSASLATSSERWKAEEKRQALDAAGRQLDAELAFLEAKLGLSKGKKDGEKKKRLVQELIDDGFDEELQGLLDDILGGNLGERGEKKRSKNMPTEDLEEREDEDEEEEDEEDEDEGEEKGEEEEDEGEGEEGGDGEDEKVEEEEEGEDDDDEEEEEEEEIDDDDEEEEEKEEEEEDDGDEEEEENQEEEEEEEKEEEDEEEDDVEETRGGAAKHGSLSSRTSAAPEGKYLPPHLRRQQEELPPGDGGEEEGEEEDSESESDACSTRGRSTLTQASPTASAVSAQSKKLTNAAFSSALSQGFVQTETRKARDAGRAITQRLRGLLNRVSEGNVEVILQQISGVIKDALAQVLASALPQASAASCAWTPKDVRNFRQAQEFAFFREMNAALVGLLTQSMIESRFSTASLIATQTALCCGLSALFDGALCREFLFALGRAFRKFFPRAVASESRLATSGDVEDAAGEPVEFYVRHLLTAFCFLFDFDVFEPAVFLGMLQRLSERPPGADAAGLGEFQVECLLLVLRLGGGKLRNENPALFKEAWASLMKRMREGEADAAGALPAAAEAQEGGDATPDDGRSRAELKAKLATRTAQTFSEEMRRRREQELENESNKGRLHYLVRELEELKNNKTSTIHLASRASQEAMRRWLQTSALLSQSPWRQCAGRSVLVSVASWKELEEGAPAAGSSPSAAQFRSATRTVSGPAERVDVAKQLGVKGATDERKLLEIATKLRLHSEEQKKIFVALMSANGLKDAVSRLLRIMPRTKQRKTFATTAVAVVLHVALQEAVFNPFYALLLACLCARCSCAAWVAAPKEADSAKPPLASPFASLSPTQRGARNSGAGAEIREGCSCFLLPEKEGKNFRRIVQRGLAAQNSAAHGFSLRRLLHLARLEAFLIRVGVVELRLARFINFEGETGKAGGQMPLTGKLGFFLKELCVQLLCLPQFASVPLPAPTSTSYSPLFAFLSLSALPDVREAFLVILEDVLLAEARAAEKGARKTPQSASGDCQAGKKGKCARVPGGVCTPLCGLREETVTRVIRFMQKQKRFEDDEDEQAYFEP